MKLDTIAMMLAVGIASCAITWAGKYSHVVKAPPHEIEQVREANERAAQQQAIAAAARISIKQTVLEGDLSEDELSDIRDLWPEWKAGEVVKQDAIRRYAKALWKCIQPHTTQADWTPDISVSLWTRIAPPGVIAAWVQPTGAHDAYHLGDRVTHEGKTWESQIDANTTEPGSDPRWWTEL